MLSLYPDHSSTNLQPEDLLHRPHKRIKLLYTRAECRSLFELPPELRLKIYHYLLVESEPIYLPLYSGSPVPLNWKLEPFRCSELRILRVSKQVNKEAIDVLYTYNTFSVDLGVARKTAFNRFALSNLRRIRRMDIVIHAQPWMNSLEPKLQSKALELIVTLLANLTRLRLEVQEYEWEQFFDRRPFIKLRPFKRLDQKDVEHYMGRWLGFINQHTSIVVEVIGDGRQHARNWFEKHLRRGFQEISDLRTLPRWKNVNYL